MDGWAMGSAVYLGVGVLLLAASWANDALRGCGADMRYMWRNIAGAVLLVLAWPYALWLVLSTER